MPQQDVKNTEASYKEEKHKTIVPRTSNCQDKVESSGHWLLATGQILDHITCFHMTSLPPYWCPKTTKRRPCWCPKPVLWELNSFLMQTPSFVPILKFAYMLVTQVKTLYCSNTWRFFCRPSHFNVDFEEVYTQPICSNHYWGSLRKQPTFQQPIRNTTHILVVSRHQCAWDCAAFVFLRRHFAEKPMLALRNVGCFFQAILGEGEGSNR